MANVTPFSKYERLKDIIRSHAKVGVAFSGGVDSSLLLFAASEVLQRDNVIALHGRSVLNVGQTSIEDLYSECFQDRAILKIVDLTPLDNAEFTGNDSRRCYHCKKKTYSTFLEVLQDEGVDCLLDGTNKDDLSEIRPGLVVLEELSVKTPLVDAGISKREVRFLAQSLGLPNHAMPSNSCLATRLVYLSEISLKELERVDKIENELKIMGYNGCRVRPQKDSLVIEIAQHDFLKFSRIHNRIAVKQLGLNFGFSKVYLDISGRQ